MRTAPGLVLAMSLGLAGMTGISGCTPVAAILDKVSPDPVESAAYVPAHDNLAVVVEDYHNPALVEETAEHLNRLIAGELVDFKVAPIVNPDRLTLLRINDPVAYHKLTIPQIGKALGAGQVLYVDVTHYIVESATGTESLRARAEARVKVVDVASGQTRWPRDATSAGIPVVVEIPFMSDNRDVTDSAIRDSLTQGIATKVASLFHDVSSERSPAPAYPESDHLQ